MYAVSGFLIVIVVLCLCVYWPWHQSASKVLVVIEEDVFVNGTASIAETDRDFICATLDYGPSDRCDHGFCWGKATLFDLDLNNKILQNAVKEFSPLKIRMGGTLQDRLIYETPGDPKPCNPMSSSGTGLFGFSKGCLSMSRWDELHSFFNRTGAIVTFGLNVLYGKTVRSGDSVTGDWNSSNAESLLRYTVSKGYPMLGWELGNELSGGRGIGASLTAKQYASDLKTLRNLVGEVYSGFRVKPSVMAPGGFFDEGWFKDFVDRANDTVQVITHHIYNLGQGSDNHLMDKILDPSYLNGVTSQVRGLQKILETSGTSAVAWIGEAGGASNSGRHLVTDAFVSSFWYLDQLGIAASHDTKTHCRQTLIGGGYGLLNSSTFLPNPDFYSALLWHRLMGSRVLSTSSRTKKIRAYSHCSKNSTGITLLLINLDKNATARVRVSVRDKYQNGTLILSQNGPSPKYKLSGNSGGSGTNGRVREEYHLTARGGDLQTQVTVLNGKILNVSSLGIFPELRPVIASLSAPLTITPYSIVFVRLPGINITACI